MNNGAYGARIAAIVERLEIPVTVVETLETSYPLEEFTDALSADPEITHVAFVHCETITGMLNPSSNGARSLKNTIVTLPV